MTDTWNVKPARVVCVTSGKGGVGKTSTTVNLAVAHAIGGRRVMLLDADMGLANVDVALGLSPRSNLAHVMCGECTLEEVIVPGPNGVKVIPASSGVRHMTELNAKERLGLIGAFSTLADVPDILYVDSASGISDSVLTFARAAHEVVVVVCDEPTSLTDAYALIKVMSREFSLGRFMVIGNRVRDERQGQALFRKLSAVCDRFLDVSLVFLGSVPEDGYLRRAVGLQQAVVDAYPSSRSAAAYRRIAAQIDRLPEPTGASGYLDLFVQQIVGVESALEGVGT